ncbi:hypothetical protein SSS_07661 [Sarcoptes scabiei]|uniref:Uncharacterized protein n=1 Tax=Sarcoptes scabiei TaxID=52283 RepID=A0A834R470_SARSC|nr:hypothetical protein SSS_07661 [Sarcoptes scabiei]
MTKLNTFEQSKQSCLKEKILTFGEMIERHHQNNDNYGSTMMIDHPQHHQHHKINQQCFDSGESFQDGRSSSSDPSLNNIVIDRNHHHHSHQQNEDHSLLVNFINNVPMKLPPIAYMNGNGVRPVRRRHFSQQQTNISDDDNQKSQASIINNNKYNSNSNSSSNSSGEILNAKKEQSKILNRESGKNMIVAAAGAEKSSSIVRQNKQSESIHRPEHLFHPLFRHLQHEDPDISSRLSDYSINDHNSCDSYDFPMNDEKMVTRLAKGIEKVLRMAKESRRLNCTELLVPQMLMAHIAADILAMADCEPCGLRGCLLLICIEDNLINQSRTNKRSPSSPTSMMNGPFDGYLRIPSSSRFLGEFAIDSNVVPTFEIFLTLKREEESWFESLENKFFKKTPIILSELYLLKKKKLYQPSSPTI